MKDEWVELPPEAQRCARCGQPFGKLGWREGSEQVEIEVRAHRRRIHRARYYRRCGCAGLPAVVTAPRGAALIPKSVYGLSVWVEILLDKYAFQRPTHRLLAALSTHGLALSAGTVTDGLRRLAPLFEPLMAGLAMRVLSEGHWHGDETCWRVFVRLEGKLGYGWWLWVFKSASAAVFVLEPSRGAAVPNEFFGEQARGVLTVDRYSAYKAMAAVKLGRIVLSYCWSHVRRDFLRIGRDWPGQGAWGEEWLEAIGAVFHLNALRCKERGNPAAFASRDAELREAVARLAARREAELAQADLLPARRRALESLRNHWAGLTIFLDHPEVPMDNSEAERRLRGPAVARKNFYGSGAVWSGRLAAAMFSLVATLDIWKLNPRLWLTAYLEACAAHGGKAPPDAASFLPWNLSEARRRELGAVPPPDT